VSSNGPKAAGRFRCALIGAALVASLLQGCAGTEMVGFIVEDSIPWLGWGSEPRDLRASAYYSDGSERDVAAAATWRSSDEAIATVSSGFVTRVSTGHVTIAASFGGMIDSVELDVP